MGMTYVATSGLDLLLPLVWRLMALAATHCLTGPAVVPETVASPVALLQSVSVPDDEQGSRRKRLLERSNCQHMASICNAASFVSIANCHAV